jgi:squalene-hopene/tetraprenyl-beta-curcumene cyclase
LLRSGQSLTAFVLQALLEVPPEIEPARPEAAARALAFLSNHINQEGALGRADPMLEDYPNYATALALRAFATGEKGKLLDRSLDYLRQQQFAEELGWKPEHPAYGAWGIGGPQRHPPHTGHLDISMTRHVLQGLSAAGTKPQDRAFARAAIFLKRCQNPDGGLVFSTVIVDANKAGRDGNQYRSYGTATADGILSLLAIGVGKSDPRVEAGLAWLRTRHRTDRVPGFPENSEENWAEGMLYYYLAASAQVFQQLEVPVAPPGKDWRKELVEALVRRQRADGAWQNPNFLMKEDDPLIATTLALMALRATL